MQRILGIDPGSRVTGYGLIESDGRKSRHITSGCIRTIQKDFSARLGEIYTDIQSIVNDEIPNQAAVEQVFVAKNPSSALKLGQARGAAVTALVVAGLPVYEYSPRSVKQALVGTGAATKEQVQHMVKILLNLDAKKNLALDQSDALAIALCHAHNMILARKLERAL